MDIIWLFVMLFGLLIIGIPVAVALAGASAVFIFFNGTPLPMVVAHRMINGVDSFPLLSAVLHSRGQPDEHCGDH